MDNSAKLPLGNNVESDSTQYDIFEVLNAAFYEKIISRFLAELLNPYAPHGLKTLPLKLFLKFIHKKTRSTLFSKEGQPLKIADINNLISSHKDLLEDTVSTTEYKIKISKKKIRFIDIAIYNHLFFIPIEVKINASDEDSQCYDYFSYANNLGNEYKSKIIYISEDKEAPYENSTKSGENSLNKKKDILHLTWQEILTFLIELKGKIINKKELKATEGFITDYDSYICAIRRFSGVRSNSLYKQAGDMLNRLYQVKSVEDGLIQLVKDLFSIFSKKIEPAFDEKSNQHKTIKDFLGVEGVTAKCVDQDYDYYVVDTKVKNLFRHNKSSFPGINYRINFKTSKETPKLQLWFRIEIDYCLFAGFALVKVIDNKATEVTNAQNKDAYRKFVTNRINEIRLNEIVDTGWMKWCYPNGSVTEDSTVPNFKNLNQAAIDLIERAKSGTLESYVDEILSIFKTRLISKIEISMINKRF